MNSEFSIAVHSLVFLNHKGCVMRSEEIAENVCTHPARVRKVLARLKRAGLVDSHEGQRQGGYRFACDPSQITLLEVLNALGERVVEPRWLSGDVEMDCLIASGISQVMARLFDEMDALCQARLSKITLWDIQRELLRRGD